MTATDILAALSGLMALLKVVLVSQRPATDDEVDKALGAIGPKREKLRAAIAEAKRRREKAGEPEPDPAAMVGEPEEETAPQEEAVGA